MSVCVCTYIRNDDPFLLKLPSVLSVVFSWGMHFSGSSTRSLTLPVDYSTMENALLGDSMIEKLRSSGTAAEKEKSDAMGGWVYGEQWFTDSVFL